LGDFIRRVRCIAQAVWDCSGGYGGVGTLEGCRGGFAGCG
jgi:hypothetical protein